MSTPVTMYQDTAGALHPSDNEADEASKVFTIKSWLNSLADTVNGMADVDTQSLAVSLQTAWTMTPNSDMATWPPTV